MQLNYKKLGENGLPLIILHGLFGMLDNWQTLGRRFAEQHTVYLIDQRNHGKSPHSMEFDYFVMADDLLEFMEQHNVESAYLLGHSMGGKTAMQFAVDNPEKVLKLMIADIAPKSYPAGHQNIFDALFTLKVDELKSRKEANEILSANIEEEGVKQFLLKNLHRKKEGGYEWKFSLEAIHQNYSSILENTLHQYDNYDGKCLFIKGANSPRYIELPEDETLIQQHFPKAKIKTLANAGHWVHAEQPLAFYELVHAFLED